MKTKDILIVRLSKQCEDMDTEAFEEMSKGYNKKLGRGYNVIVIKGENDTNKTSHEIIKY